MTRERGELIEVSFQLKNHRDQIENLNHPAIIISNEDVYNTDSSYICVMITHSKINDLFTFKLANDMFVKNFISGDNSVQARCHLVTYVYDEHIIKNTSGYNKMKPRSVDRLVEHISQKALGSFDF